MLPSPHLLLLDSGLGGLSVAKAVRSVLPQARLTYIADDAAFPYGSWEEAALSDHLADLVGRLIENHAPDIVILACNTASTLVLARLRESFDTPFVGTVPAIKPAAERTKSGLVSVLATPGTVRRDYTQKLLKDFSGKAEFTLVAAPSLAGEAERYLIGEEVDPASILDNVRPCFVEADGRRTDTIVLGCTHYPLLLPVLQELSPWPVEWINPAPAIARRVVALLGDDDFVVKDTAYQQLDSFSYTSGKALPLRLSCLLQSHGLLLAAPALAATG